MARHTDLGLTDVSASRGEDLCVARVPIFQDLPRSQQEDIARVARPAHFAAGEIVSGPAQSAPTLLVVHTGAAKVSRTDADGHEQVLRVLRPGQFTGETSLISGQPADHLITALEPTRMCTFRYADFREVIERHPSIALKMLQSVTERLTQTERRLASAISSDVSARLAGYLLSLPSTPGPNGPEVRLPMAKKDVASLLDTTPESLSRQLRSLRDSGVVVHGSGRNLVIRDVDVLLELSPAGSDTER